MRPRRSLREARQILASEGVNDPEARAELDASEDVLGCSVAAQARYLRTEPAPELRKWAQDWRRAGA